MHTQECPDLRCQFTGELTAQVGISEFSEKEDCKTWYENEKRVCGQVSYET